MGRPAQLVAAFFVLDAIDDLTIYPATTTMPRAKAGIIAARAPCDGCGQRSTALPALDGLRSGYDPLVPHMVSRDIWRPNIGFVMAKQLPRLGTGNARHAVFQPCRPQAPGSARHGDLRARRRCIEYMA